MKDIQITFIFQERQYTGFFRPIEGAGAAATWHLMTHDHYYLGQLFESSYGFQFFGSVKGMEEMAQYFGQVVAKSYK